MVYVNWWILHCGNPMKWKHHLSPNLLLCYTNTPPFHNVLTRKSLKSINSSTACTTVLQFPSNNIENQFPALFQCSSVSIMLQNFKLFTTMPQWHWALSLSGGWWGKMFNYQFTYIRIAFYSTLHASYNFHGHTKKKKTHTHKTNICIRAPT